VVQWRKQRWRCRTPDCPRQTFNALIESTNTKIRLLQRMVFRFASADALIALAMLSAPPPGRPRAADLASRELPRPQQRAPGGVGVKDGRIAWPIPHPNTFPARSTQATRRGSVGGWTGTESLIVSEETDAGRLRSKSG
jgi:hypothetical protein